MEIIHPSYKEIVFKKTWESIPIKPIQPKNILDLFNGSEIIFPWGRGSGLGDLTLVLGGAINLMNACGKNNIKINHKETKYKTKLQELINAYDLNNIINLVFERDKKDRNLAAKRICHVRSLAYYINFPYPHLKYKTQWEPKEETNSHIITKNKYICYQDIGKTIKPSSDQLAKFSETVKFIEENGIKCIKLDKSVSIKECLELLAGCDLFIGVDSGMAQLAYTVGCPVFLPHFNKLNYSFHVKNFHKYMPYYLETFDQIHEKIKMFLLPNEGFCIEKLDNIKIEKVLYGYEDKKIEITNFFISMCKNYFKDIQTAHFHKYITDPARGKRKKIEIDYQLNGISKQNISTQFDRITLYE